MAGKTFRFSLGSVLELRVHETEQAQHGLRRAASARQQQEAAVQQARQALGRLTAEDVPGTLSPAALRRQEVHRHAALDACEEARRGLERLRRLETQARTRLQRRHRAEASLKMLEDRERGRHRRARQQADAAFLDEQATTGFQRRRRAADHAARHAVPSGA